MYTRAAAMPWRQGCIAVDPAWTPSTLVRQHYSSPRPHQTASWATNHESWYDTWLRCYILFWKITLKSKRQLCICVRCARAAHNGDVPLNQDMYPYDSLYIRVSNLSCSLIRFLLNDICICEWESERERKGKGKHQKKSVKRKRQLERKRSLNLKGKESVRQKKDASVNSRRNKVTSCKPRVIHEARPNRLHATRLHFLPIRRRITCQKIRICTWYWVRAFFSFLVSIGCFEAVQLTLFSLSELLLDLKKLSDSDREVGGANCGFVP